MGLGQVAPTPEQRIDTADKALKEEFDNKDIIEKDNGTKVDELLKKFGTDGVLDTKELNKLYIQITGELNTKGEDSTIEDSSLLRVANVIAKLGRLESNGFNENIQYNNFIKELSKEYKPKLEKNITELNDGEPKVIDIAKSGTTKEILLATYKEGLLTYGTDNIKVISSGDKILIYSAKEEYPHNKTDLDELIKSIDYSSKEEVVKETLKSLEN